MISSCSWSLSLGQHIFVEEKNFIGVGAADHRNNSLLKHPLSLKGFSRFSKHACMPILDMSVPWPCFSSGGNTKLSSNFVFLPNEKHQFKV